VPIINAVHKFPHVRTVWDVTVGRNLEVKGMEVVRATEIVYGDREIRQGYDLVLYSDDGVTLTARIDGAVGYADVRRAHASEWISVGGTPKKVRKMPKFQRFRFIERDGELILKYGGKIVLKINREGILFIRGVRTWAGS